MKVRYKVTLEVDIDKDEEESHEALERLVEEAIEMTLADLADGEGGTTCGVQFLDVRGVVATNVPIA